VEQTIRTGSQRQQRRASCLRWQRSITVFLGGGVKFLVTRLRAFVIKDDKYDSVTDADLCKSAAAQEVRTLLTARKLVQSKLYEVERSLRGIPRCFALKVGPITSKRLSGRQWPCGLGHGREIPAGGPRSVIA